jgi:hypothetical protein
MPNWCLNQLVVTGPEHQRMVPVWNAGNVLSTLIPMPSSFSDEELAELGAFVRQSGLGEFDSREVSHWWREKNWGIKWDVDETVVRTSDQETVIDFESPWSPPIAGLRTISAMYPDLQFRLLCCEPSCHFAGEIVFEAGEELSGVCYDSGPDYQRIADKLGLVCLFLEEDDGQEPPSPDAD